MDPWRAGMNATALGVPDAVTVSAAQRATRRRDHHAIVHRTGQGLRALICPEPRVPRPHSGPAGGSPRRELASGAGCGRSGADRTPPIDESSTSTGCAESGCRFSTACSPRRPAAICDSMRPRAIGDRRRRNPGTPRARVRRLLARHGSRTTVRLLPWRRRRRFWRTGSRRRWSTGNPVMRSVYIALAGPLIKDR